MLEPETPPPGAYAPPVGACVLDGLGQVPDLRQVDKSQGVGSCPVEESEGRGGNGVCGWEVIFSPDA